MTSNQYYSRKSGLLHIYDQIERYVTEVMAEDHYVGMTDITTQVVENLSAEINNDVNRVIEYAYGMPASSVFGDTKMTKSSPFFYKRNKYNLNLLNDRFKIKVWLGATARVARENFSIAYEKYPEYHKNFWVRVFEHGLYRIECYRLVRGYTIDDIIRNKPTAGSWYGIEELGETKEKLIYEYMDKFKHSNGDGSLMTSIIEPFHNFVAERVHTTRYMKKIYYPNDCNPGNFVVDFDSERSWPHNLVMMDYDHMIITNPKHMIHNVAWQFFSRIFDTDTLPDEDTVTEVLDWRNSHDLFDEVEKFKIRYLDLVNIEYDSDKECFKYNVPRSSLNGSEFLYNYVNEKKQEKSIEIEKPLHNEKGAEIIDESDYDNDDLE